MKSIRDMWEVGPWQSHDRYSGKKNCKLAFEIAFGELDK
jgi:hypothetical protein